MGLTYNGVTPTKITYNGTELAKVIYNGHEVWSSGLADLTGTTWDINQNPDSSPVGTLRRNLSGTIAGYSFNEFFWFNNTAADGLLEFPVTAGTDTIGVCYHYAWKSPYWFYTTKMNALNKPSGSISLNIPVRIMITGGTAATDADLITWFENNATQII